MLWSPAAAPWRAVFLALLTIPEMFYEKTFQCMYTVVLLYLVPFSDKEIKGTLCIASSLSLSMERNTC